jgi:hypothetical protein
VADINVQGIGELNPISTIAKVVQDVLDRVIPDKTANQAAKNELAEMALKGQLDAILANLEINKVEAASNSTFVAGWRPFVGWTCGVGVAYAFIVQPFLQFLLVAFHSNFDQTKLPSLNLVQLIGLLMSMLGFGVMRTVDKSNGTDNGH